MTYKQFVLICGRERTVGNILEVSLLPKGKPSSLLADNICLGHSRVYTPPEESAKWTQRLRHMKLPLLISITYKAQLSIVTTTLLLKSDKNL